MKLYSAEHEMLAGCDLLGQRISGRYLVAEARLESLNGRRVSHPRLVCSGGDFCCLGNDLVRHRPGSRTARDPGTPAKLSILIPYPPG